MDRIRDAKINSGEERKGGTERYEKRDKILKEYGSSLKLYKRNKKKMW